MPILVKLGCVSKKGLDTYKINQRGYKTYGRNELSRIRAI